MPESDNKTKQLIEAGTEIAGAAVSGALGFLFGGPAGAAGAGALGVVVAKSAKKLITDMANRHLSHQEEIKVGAAAAFAMSVIEDRLKKGDRPRDDDFFTKKNGENSSAEEIFEEFFSRARMNMKKRK